MSQEGGATPYTKHTKGCGHCYDVICNVVLSQEGGTNPYSKHTKGCGHCYDVIYDVCHRWVGPPCTPTYYCCFCFIAVGDLGFCSVQNPRVSIQFRCTAGCTCVTAVPFNHEIIRISHHHCWSCFLIFRHHPSYVVIIIVITVRVPVSLTFIMLLSKASTE